MGEPSQITFTFVPAIWIGVAYHRNFRELVIFIPFLAISISTMKEKKWFTFSK